MPWGTRLVGRNAEIAELEREYRRAAAGEFHPVVLLADAGIGKHVFRVNQNISPGPPADAESG